MSCRERGRGGDPEIGSVEVKENVKKVIQVLIDKQFKKFFYRAEWLLFSGHLG